jgi:hypothetical protein
VNAGSLRLSHPLDFDLSPGTAVGGNPRASAHFWAIWVD